MQTAPPLTRRQAALTSFGRHTKCNARWRGCAALCPPRLFRALPRCGSVGAARPLRRCPAAAPLRPCARCGVRVLARAKCRRCVRRLRGLRFPPRRLCCALALLRAPCARALPAVGLRWLAAGRAGSPRGSRFARAALRSASGGRAGGGGAPPACGALRPPAAWGFFRCGGLFSAAAGLCAHAGARRMRGTAYKSRCHIRNQSPLLLGVAPAVCCSPPAQNSCGNWLTPVEQISH